MQSNHNHHFLYPVFTMYVAGVFVACGISAGWFGKDAGLIVLTTVAAMLILIAVLREILIVRILVSTQRDELCERIDHLTGLLEDAGIPVPKRKDDPCD